MAIPFLNIPDTVAVFNFETFEQVFALAKIIKVVIREPSKTMEHPAENGIIIADHRIILQKDLDFHLIVTSENYSAVYNEIKNLFLNTTLLSAQTRTAVYDNLIIADLPHEETADMFDAVTISLHLREILFTPTPATYVPENPDNQNTSLNGQQQITAPAEPPAEYGKYWFNQKTWAESQ